MFEQSIKLGKKLKKAGIKMGKSFTVKMLYTKEVDNFLNLIEEAHKQAGKSKLVFKL